MPVPGSYAHGPWRLTKPDWYSPWIATHTGTGEERDTECRNINDALATLPPDTAQPGRASGGTYTIASGPQRARTGHQRYRKKFLEQPDDSAGDE